MRLWKPKGDTTVDHQRIQDLLHSIQALVIEAQEALANDDVLSLASCVNAIITDCSDAELIELVESCGIARSDATRVLIESRT
jgi:hypothetical protein